MAGIRRRDFLEMSSAGFGGLSLAPRRIGAGGDGERPNILFILADDQRFDTLGCAGDPDAKAVLAGLRESCDRWIRALMADREKFQ